MKHLLRGLAVGLMLTFFISGCAVNQEKDVRIYRHVIDTGKSAQAVPFHPENPLTLKNALELANAKNEQLAMAGENYLQAVIDKDRAFAAFLPTIRLVPTFLRQGKTAFAAENTMIAEFEPPRATDLPVEGNINLHPFRDIPALKAAGSSARMQRALLLDRQAVLMLDVAMTYFQVMHSEKQVEVFQYTINVDEQRLADLRVKEKAGVARPVDVALAEAQLAQTRNALIGSRGDVKNGRAMLAFLISAPAVNGPLAGGLTVPSEDWQIGPLLKLADTHRQGLIVAHEQVKAAADELEAAWGEYFPSVSLNLIRYLSRDTFPNDMDWTSLIQVHVPIFSAGLIHADVRTAYSRLRQTRFAEIYAQRQVMKDLQVAVENLKADGQQIDQGEIQVKAAQDGMQQADSGFNAGLETNLQRLIAQDKLLSAQLDLSTAKLNQNVDYLKLLRVIGTLKPDISEALPSPETNPPEIKK